MKNVLIINHFAGAPNINERSLRHYLLANYLNSKGNNCTIISSCDTYQSSSSNNFQNNKVTIINGVKFFFIKEKFFKKNNLFTKFLRMTSFSLNLLKSFILGRIDTKKIDIVVSSSPDLFTSLVSYYISKKNKSKFILEIRDIWPLSQIVHHKFSKKHPIIIILRMIEEFLHNRADYVISPLNNYQKYLDENNFKVNYSYCPQVYNIDEKKSKLNIEIPYSKFEKIGIYAGTVGSLYKVESIIQYFPKNLSTKIGIIIIGDGDRWDHLNDLINKKNAKNIFLVKSVKKELLINYYEISDFAISIHPDKPELYKYGLCPLKTLDYMHNSLPVLFLGNKSYLKSGYSKGLIQANFDDKISFQSSIENISSFSKDKLVKLGKENYKIANKLNNPNLLYSVYEEIVNQNV